MPARGSGIREKLKSASQPDSNAPAGAVLKRLYKKGKLSAPDIVEASQALPRSSGTATQDGPSKWATAGHGRRKHMSRDIMRSMTASSTKPEIYSTHMTFWDPDLNEQVEDEVYCLIPYETVDKLADRDGDLSQYTSLPEGSPFIRRKAEWMERVGAQGDGHDIVCCGLWGDGAAYHTRDSLGLLLFNMISGIIRTRFWIATWSKRLSCNCGCHGRCTLASFWRFLAWMFTAWMTGIYPLVRDDGTLFEDSDRPGDKQRAEWGRQKRPMRTRGALLQERADWSWHKCLLGLCGWAGEGALLRRCFKCLANTSTLPFTDPTLNALWRARYINHYLFMQLAYASGNFISEIFDIPGFRYEYVDLDLMHTGDLGITQVLLGNTLLELFVKIGGVVTKPGDAMGELTMLIKMAAKQIDPPMDSPPLNKMAYTMIRQGAKPPRLRANAAETRGMLRCVRRLLETYFKPENDHEVLRLQCVIALSDFYASLVAKPFKGGVTSDLGRRRLILYAELCKEAAGDTGMMPVSWKWYPTHHQFSHLCEDQVRDCGNPMDHWCYADEDAIGQAVHVAESGHAKTLHRLVIEKHRIE